MGAGQPGLHSTTVSKNQTKIKKQTKNQKPIKQTPKTKQKLPKQTKSQTKHQTANQAAENCAQGNVRNKRFSHDKSRTEQQNKSPLPVPKMCHYMRLQPNQQLLMSSPGRRSHEPALMPCQQTLVLARRLSVRLSERPCCSASWSPIWKCGRGVRALLQHRKDNCSHSKEQSGNSFVIRKKNGIFLYKTLYLYLS